MFSSAVLYFHPSLLRFRCCKHRQPGHFYQQGEWAVTGSPGTRTNRFLLSMNKFRLGSRRIYVVIQTVSFWSSFPAVLERAKPPITFKCNVWEELLVVAGGWTGCLRRSLAVLFSHVHAYVGQGKRWYLPSPLQSHTGAAAVWLFHNLPFGSIWSSVASPWGVNCIYLVLRKYK